MATIFLPQHVAQKNVGNSSTFHWKIVHELQRNSSETPPKIHRNNLWQKKNVARGLLANGPTKFQRKLENLTKCPAKMWKCENLTNFPRSTLAKIQFYPKSLQINFGWILLDIYIYIIIYIIYIYISTPNIYTKFRWNSKLVDISLGRRVVAGKSLLPVIGSLRNFGWVLTSRQRQLKRSNCLEDLNETSSECGGFP